MLLLEQVERGTCGFLRHLHFAALHRIRAIQRNHQREILALFLCAKLHRQHLLHRRIAVTLLAVHILAAREEQAAAQIADIGFDSPHPVGRECFCRRVAQDQRIVGCKPRGGGRQRGGRDDAHVDALAGQGVGQITRGFCFSALYVEDAWPRLDPHRLLHAIVIGNGIAFGNDFGRQSGRSGSCQPRFEGHPVQAGFQSHISLAQHTLRLRERHSCHGIDAGNHAHGHGHRFARMNICGHVDARNPGIVVLSDFRRNRIYAHMGLRQARQYTPDVAGGLVAIGQQYDALGAIAIQAHQGGIQRLFDVGRCLVDDVRVGCRAPQRIFRDGEAAYVRRPAQHHRVISECQIARLRRCALPIGLFDPFDRRVDEGGRHAARDVHRIDDRYVA